MLYYKVYRDRDFNNYVPIDETELEKAQAAFRFGTSVIFNSGALEKVGDILPDFNRTMGWNPSHKLENDDWSDIQNKGIENKLHSFSQLVKDKIDYLIATKQEHLIGKNVDVEGLKQVENRGGSLKENLKDAWDRLDNIHKN